MVWLFDEGVSLILPDVQFGMVSLDWVTFANKIFFPGATPLRYCITALQVQS